MTMSKDDMPAELRDVILNENMMTVHRRRAGGGRYEPDCGHRFAHGSDRLRVTSMEEATVSRTATMCGDCFEEGGGY